MAWAPLKVTVTRAPQRPHSDRFRAGRAGPGASASSRHLHGPRPRGAGSPGGGGGAGEDGDLTAIAGQGNAAPAASSGLNGTNRRPLARARRLLEQRCGVRRLGPGPGFSLAPSARAPAPIRTATGRPGVRPPPPARNGTVTSRSLAISAAKNTDRGPSSSESPGEAETEGTVAGTESMARGQATEATLPRGAAPGAPPVTGSPFGKDPRGGRWQ